MFFLSSSVIKRDLWFKAIGKVKTSHPSGRFVRPNRSSTCPRAIESDIWLRNRDKRRTWIWFCPSSCFERRGHSSRRFRVVAWIRSPPSTWRAETSSAATYGTSRPRFPSHLKNWWIKVLTQLSTSWSAKCSWHWLRMKVTPRRKSQFVGRTDSIDLQKLFLSNCPFKQNAIVHGSKTILVKYYCYLPTALFFPILSGLYSSQKFRNNWRWEWFFSRWNNKWGI